MPIRGYAKDGAVGLEVPLGFPGFSRQLLRPLHGAARQRGRGTLVCFAVPPAAAERGGWTASQSLGHCLTTVNENLQLFTEFHPTVQGKLVPNPLITKNSVGFLDVLPHFATVSWHLGEVAKKIHGWWDSEAEMPEEIGGALSRAMRPICPALSRPGRHHQLTSTHPPPKFMKHAMVKRCFLYLVAHPS